MHKLAIFGASFALVLLSGCSDDDDAVNTTSTDIQFAAKVGTADFVEGTVYSSIGNGTVTDYRIDDLRLYIDNVVLKTDIDEEVPLELNQDGVWQYRKLALLDFESTKTTETNMAISGKFDTPTGTINEICFDVGVPFELNHLNNTDSPSPLNASGMFWKWQSGHKFLRVDGVGDPSGAAIPYNIHLGSTGCTSGSATESPSQVCTYANIPHVCLSNFSLDTKQVVIDLESALSTSDITAVTANTAPGCMSGNNDPQCQTIMPRMGLNFVYDDGSNPAQIYPAESQGWFSLADI